MQAAPAHLDQHQQNAGHSILVVEDDEDIAGALAAVLEDAGYRVRVAENGREALDSLAQARADLILLDLMMPVMNGWEFRVAQKQDPSISDIPVIVMSADQSAKAAAVHAETYVSKPFDTSKLLLAIERVLLEQERRKLAARLDQTERLALLGTIAAGVGHEVNNPLSYVMSSLVLADESLNELRSDFAQLRRACLSADEGALRRLEARLSDIDELLRNGRAGAERMRLIVRNLQSLSRREGTRAELDLSTVLESSISMAWAQIRARARLVKVFRDVPKVVGDEVRLGQLFVNLLVNAAHAVQNPDATKNEIRIELRNEPGQVIVDVADNGKGIPPSVAARIFEPFFTTKGPNEGTGLGLAICREAAEAHGGTIEVHSELNQGSCFTVRLPAVATASDHADGRHSTSPPQPSSRARSAKLWLIDDEAFVAQPIARLLAKDHQVEVMTQAKVALDRLAAGERPEIIVTDLMMPGISGMDLYAALESRYPELTERVILISGGAYTTEAASFVELHRERYLEKPVDIKQLRSLIQELLREAKPLAELAS